MGIREDIANYRPFNEQERRDKQVILDFLDNNGDAFLRSNLVAHMTASAWIVNPERTKTLLVYHRIFDSWSWTGGHADGEEDLLAVALREVREETGVKAPGRSWRISISWRCSPWTATKSMGNMCQAICT